MMRSFILLALIADNPAAAGMFDFFDAFNPFKPQQKINGSPPNGGGAPDIIGNLLGGVAGFIQPANLRQPARQPGSSLAKKVCNFAAPTAGAVAGTIPVAGGIITSANAALNMVGVTNDVRCDLAVTGARIIHQNAVNVLTGMNIDPNAGLLAPITNGMHHFLGVTPNENLQIVDNIFDGVAPMLSGGSPGYQSTGGYYGPPAGGYYGPPANNVYGPPPPDAGAYGPPPPAYAPVGGNQNGSMPGQQMQPGMAAAPGMGYGGHGPLIGSR